MNENHHRTIWLSVVTAMAVFAFGATVYQSSRMEALSRQINAYQKDNNALREKLLQSGAELQSALGSVHQELQTARDEASTSLTMAQRAAIKRADLLAQRQKEQSVQLNAELKKVEASTVEAAAKLDGISNDVGSVKTDVGSVKGDVETAKSNIEAAQTELQHVRGDLGMMSGLVATNEKQIQMLRDLGDRNIYEFTISKSVGVQKVGDIQVALRKTDAKRNRYTVDVLADDKRVEKKDKSINEPVQFYTSSARQPYELVVNQVSKDRIVGYLATPKITISRK